MTTVIPTHHPAVTYDFDAWSTQNEELFDSPYEALFAKTVVPLIAGVTPDLITAQFPFTDTDGRQRYCDFVIRQGSAIRIAIEIDGFDKTGTGQGMSHDEFVQWQRRQASLTAQAWYVLRFANRDVRDQPERCAREINRLLARLREQSRGAPDAIVDQHRHHEPHLTQRRRSWKAAPSWGSLIVLGVLASMFWRSGDRSPDSTMADSPRMHVATGESKTWSPNTAARETAPASASARGDASLVQTRYPVNQLPVGAIASATNPRGSSCRDPIGWDEALGHVGQVVAVTGPIVRIAQRDDVRGRPTWIELGRRFPDQARLTLVGWGLDKAELPDGSMIGRPVCVTGKITLYEGAAQVELATARQIHLVQ